MKIVSTASETSAESFDLPCDQLTPYNLQTLYTLSNIQVIPQPSNVVVVAVDNLYSVPEDSVVVRVTGTPTNFGAGAQAKQRTNMAAGAKLRLVKALKEQIDEIKKAEQQQAKKASPTPAVPGVVSVPSAVPPPSTMLSQQPFVAATKKPQATASSPSATPLEEPREKSTTDYSKPPEVVPMSEATVNAQFTCKYCKQAVPELNRIMHEMGCKRNKTECSFCHAYFIDKELAAHVEEAHVDYPCPHCKKNFKKNVIEEHTSCCTEKPVPCQHCERKMAASVIMYHEATCEAKTEKCQDCGTYVGMNQMAKHQRTECTARPGLGGSGGGGGSFGSGSSGLGQMSERDIMREVQRMLPTPSGRGSTSPPPPPLASGARTDPIDLDDHPSYVGLSDAEMARKLQEEEYGGSAGAPPSAAVQPPPTLSSSTSGLGVGGIEGYNPADFDDNAPPPEDTMHPTMLGGFDRVSSDEEADMSAALIRRLIQEGTEGDTAFARGLAGSSSIGGGGHGFVQPEYRGIGSGRHNPPAPRVTPPTRGPNPPVQETDEEMAARLAQEEWGS